MINSMKSDAAAFFPLQSFFVTGLAKSSRRVRSFFSASGANAEGRGIIFAVHSFIAGFAESVRGMFFELAALDAFDAGRFVISPVFFDVTGLAKSERTLRFKLSAFRTNYFFRFIIILVLFFITTFTKTLGIMPLGLAASFTLNHGFAVCSFFNHVLEKHSTRIDSRRQVVLFVDTRRLGL